jgi:hypothetical protein
MMIKPGAPIIASNEEGDMSKILEIDHLAGGLRLPCLAKLGQGNSGYKIIEEFLHEAAVGLLNSGTVPGLFGLLERPP